ncbi:MAG: response regulator [Acidimicrobiales bacterium]
MLVCDDEPDIRLLYRDAFELEGAEVDEARDGDEAMRMAAQHPPDLVVLDLLMPNRDGLATLSSMRQDHPDTVIVMVTAYAAVDAFEACRSAGAAACYEKIAFLPRIPELVRRHAAARPEGSGASLS